jgi:protein-disulfide isomerase
VTLVSLASRLKAASAIILLVMSYGTSASCSTSAQPAKPASATDVVAAVGATRITLAQVDDVALQQPAGNFGSLKLSQAVYEARRAAIDNLVGDALIEQEAKARGVDRLALVEQEVSSKVTPPTDAEVTAWYQANQERVGGASLDQARSAIRAYMIQERGRSARQEFLERLKTKTPVRVTLEPPRQTVRGAADSPTRGPASAPIEMIEFSDFQCPYCQRAHPTVRKVLEAYGERIRLVYRHYPLPNHPNARPAAEAAQCANEQGKFWPYHDRLFATPNKLRDADLKQTAVELGLESTRFNQCVDSHKYKAAVDSDLKAGEDAGVSGTPAFFINGRELSGAQPFEAFKRVIDEELEQKKARSPL